MAARIVVFMNQKGGVGKTTATVNIGFFLAREHRKRMLLVDLDPQGNLSEHMGLTPWEIEDSVYDVLVNDADPRRVIRRVHGLEVLPAKQELSGAEIELPRLENWNLRLRGALDRLRGQYDFILMDCPPSLGVLTVLGLMAADSVLVPMEAEYLALLGIGQLLKTIDLIRKADNPSLEVAGVLFCRFDGRTTLARGVRDEVEKFFPGKIFSVSIRQNIRLAEAPSHRLPIGEYDPKSPGADDYRKAAAEFLSRLDRLDDIPEIEVDMESGRSPEDIMAETPVAPEARDGRGVWQRQPIWR